MAALSRGKMFIPLMTQCRHSHRINTKRPRKAHLDRRIFDEVTAPILPQVLHDPYKDCPRLKRLVEARDSLKLQEKVEENRYEQFLVRNCRKMFDNNQMIIIFQPVSMTGREKWELWVKLKQQGFLLESFGNRIVRLAIQDSKWQNLEPVLQGNNIYVSCPDIQVQKMIKTTQKMAEIVLLGGVVGNHIFTREGLLRYAKLPSIDMLRGELVAVLNSAASKTHQLLGQHQVTLAQNLEQYIKDHTPDQSHES